MTEVLVNIGSAKLAERAAALEVGGVGLMRGEFLFYSLGIHPATFVEEGSTDKLESALLEGIRTVAAAFAPRPVRYRTLDFKSNEMRSLLNGDKYETVEANPALGLRGASRYMRDRDVFLTELRAIAALRAEGFTRLEVMIPFVRSGAELEFCRAAIAEVGLDDDLRIWAMLEVPALIYMVEELAPFIDGVSVGTNDLAQLMLGVDRDNPEVAALYDDGHPAVVRAVTTMVREAKGLGLSTSICGDRPGRDPGFTAALVEAGIDSISVPMDAIEPTRAALRAALVG